MSGPPRFRPPILGSPRTARPVMTEQSRSLPDVPTPQVSTRSSTTTQPSETGTIFTFANGQEQQLYTGDRSWAQVTVMLESAGPVAVAFKQNFTPVLSGKGSLLITNIPRTFICAKGSRIWIAATSINRVQVTVEPLPWLEQLVGLQLESNAVEGSVVAALRALPAQIAAALRGRG